MVQYTKGTTNTTWIYWVSSNCDNATTSSLNTTWIRWCDSPSYTTETTDCTDGVWVFWATARPVQYSTRETINIQPKTEEELQKEREDAAKREAEQKAEMELREATRRAAREKALQLLLENLDENQTEVFKNTGAIPVTSPSGRKYRIVKGRSRNVEELDETGKKVKNLCFHPSEQVPDFDTMLAQKLMLELHEDRARQIANFS